MTPSPPSRPGFSNLNMHSPLAGGGGGRGSHQKAALNDEGLAETHLSAQLPVRPALLAPDNTERGQVGGSRLYPISPELSSSMPTFYSITTTPGMH